MAGAFRTPPTRPVESIRLCGRAKPWQAQCGDHRATTDAQPGFHQAKIGDMMFEGIMTWSGPALSCQMSGGVALGVSGLRQFQPEAIGSRRPPPAGWWVVKYHFEERVFLPDFNRDSIRELSNEFGLVVLADDTVDPSHRIRQHYFFTSPAWEGLRQWVIDHPRLARTYAPYDPYLPLWYQRAIVEADALSASPAPLLSPGRGTAWL